MPKFQDGPFKVIKKDGLRKAKRNLHSSKCDFGWGDNTRVGDEEGKRQMTNLDHIMAQIDRERRKLWNEAHMAVLEAMEKHDILVTPVFFCPPLGQHYFVQVHRSWGINAVNIYSLPLGRNHKRVYINPWTDEYLEVAVWLVLKGADEEWNIKK